MLENHRHHECDEEHNVDEDDHNDDVDFYG